jgi:RNA polymerase sigma factor (TIGR02999 family)
MSDVTTLLDRWNSGDEDALKELIGVVHGELRILAAAQLRRERPGHTLQPTALVHEAYLRLAGLREMPVTSRRHFYGIAAEAMRRILVDYARQRSAEKRGGSDVVHVPLEIALNVPLDVRVDFVRLDEALGSLRALAPEKAQVVELRYFGGLSIEETAEAMELSPATVKRHWTFARAWLYRALGGE